MKVCHCQVLSASFNARASISEHKVQQHPGQPWECLDTTWPHYRTDQHRQKATVFTQHTVQGLTSLTA
jgi:hypothetical protein